MTRLDRKLARRIKIMSTLMVPLGILGYLGMTLRAYQEISSGHGLDPVLIPAAGISSYVVWLMSTSLIMITLALVMLVRFIFHRKKNDKRRSMNRTAANQRIQRTKGR